MSEKVEIEKVKVKIKGVKDRRGRTLLNTFDKAVDWARELSSRGAAFVFALLGVITQTLHNSFIAYELSSFEDPWLRLGQATIMAAFISLALMYFVLIADGKEYGKNNLVVNQFFAFEVFVNIYYYVNRIVFVPLNEGNLEWTWVNMWNLNLSELVIAIPFAMIIPYILKSYAGQIHAHKPAVALDAEDFVKEGELKGIREEFAAMQKNMDEFGVNEDGSVFEMAKNTQENAKSISELTKKIDEFDSNFKQYVKIADEAIQIARPGETAAFIDRDEIKEIVTKYMGEHPDYSAFDKDSLNKMFEQYVVDTIGKPKKIREVLLTIPEMAKNYNNTLKKGEVVKLKRKDGSGETTVTIE